MANGLEAIKCLENQAFTPCIAPRAGFPGEMLIPPWQFPFLLPSPLRLLNVTCLCDSLRAFSPLPAPLSARSGSHPCGTLSVERRGSPGGVRPVGKVPEHHGSQCDTDEEEGRCCLVQPALLAHEVPLKHKAKPHLVPLKHKPKNHI